MFTSRQSPERRSASILRRKQLGSATLVRSTLITRFRAGVLVVIAALTISARFGYAAVPEEKGPTHLNKHQLKTMQKTAHTADDFCLLSKFYTQESARLKRKAREHQEEADGYASRRVFEPKTGFPGGLLAHCRYFAWYYHQKAEQQRSLAAYYEDMAKSGQKVSPRDCTLECVKAGNKYVFVSKGQVYEIANQNLPDLEKHAGDKVQLTGNLGSDDKTITVAKIQVAH